VADNAWIAAGPSPTPCSPTDAEHRLPRGEDPPVRPDAGAGGVDLYNVMNVDVVTNYNQAFVPGGSWLTPTALQPARYARISMQLDF